MKNWLVSLLLSLVAALPAAAQKFPDLAQTPPMGWNSWNTFGGDINEQLVRGVADAMEASAKEE